MARVGTSIAGYVQARHAPPAKDDVLLASCHLGPNCTRPLQRLHMLGQEGREHRPRER
jgi:hypothetical protein